MSAKIHIIAVTCIVFAMFLAWQMLVSLQEARVAAVAPPPQSPYSIEMIHATYNDRCSRGQESDGSAPPTQVDDHADNVLALLSKLCNHKIACSVPVSKDLLGGEATPCMIRELSVEYRCFAVDRPWKVTAREGSTLEMKCEQR